MKKRHLSPGMAQQKGAALIFVLFALMMMSGIVYHWLERENRLIKEQAYHFALYQALQYQEAVEAWTMAMMANDDKAIDALDEAWNMGMPPFPVEGGSVQGALRDAQALWNLNSLYAISTQKENTALVATLQAQENLTGLAFVDLLLDWLDADSEQRPRGAENFSYLQNPQASGIANGLFISLGQLTDLLGMRAELLDWLMARFTVLPQVTPVNINTAPAEVLSMLDSRLTPSDIAQLVSLRQTQPFESFSGFQDWLKERLQLDTISLKELTDRLTSQLISVNSQYFWLTTQIQLGDAAFRFETLLHRNDQGKFDRVHRRQG